jgi:hypothetical protein
LFKLQFLADHHEAMTWWQCCFAGYRRLRWKIRFGRLDICSLSVLYAWSMNALRSVAGPVFTASLRQGRTECGLFDLMAAAWRGDLVDLPGMAAHQRAPFVTVMAILMHVIARYMEVDWSDRISWARAWEKLIGPDALRITAPYEQVAFLQPPTSKPTSPQSIEAADLLLPNVEHEVKRTWVTRCAETAIFSPVGSISRPTVKDHRSSTRTGLCAALASVDATLGSEICSLVAAYEHLDLPSRRSNEARDHFVWLRAYRPKQDAPIPFADLPRPFLDIGRAQRIIETKSGEFQIWACPNNNIRVTGADPWLDDPHTPKEIKEGGVGRYKLAAKLFDHRFQHHVLFGRIDKLRTVERPRVLNLVEYRYVRLCALGTDQGKTKGYREAVTAKRCSRPPGRMDFFTLTRRLPKIGRHACRPPHWERSKPAQRYSTRPWPFFILTPTISP